MSDYQPALDRLRERRKGKPGEFLLIFGLCCLLLAPFGLFLTIQEGARLEALKSEGMVATATVKDKSVRSESYTDRKGRSKTRDLYTLNLSHDLNAQLTFADWKAGKPFPKSQYPAVTETSIDVGESYFDGLAAGGQATVVSIPSVYKSMMLTEQLEYETSLAYMIWWYLGTAAVVMAGFVMTLIGWRKWLSRA